MVAEAPLGATDCWRACAWRSRCLPVRSAAIKPHRSYVVWATNSEYVSNWTRHANARQWIADWMRVLQVSARAARHRVHCAQHVLH